MRPILLAYVFARMISFENNSLKLNKHKIYLVKFPRSSTKMYQFLNVSGN